ncbi:MAG: hypothetical protein HYU28_06635 [Actinobacteria bacterium]|nr:hypothetical protein [Actinomycetota bacterium]
MLALGSLAGVPARASVTAPAAQDGPGWVPEVQALLDARAAAVLARDREAFMATVDPDASDTFRRAQDTLFTGMSSVPFEAYRLEVRADEVEDLSAAVPDDRGEDEMHLPLVEERFRLAGIDAVDAVHDLWYTFVRRGDRWYLNEDNDVSDLGLLTQRHLWSFGEVAVTDGSNVAVLSAPADADRARALLEITEEGMVRLRESLDWAAPPKVAVMVPGSTSQLEEILQTNFDLTNFVAFASADVDRGEEAGGWAWTAPRIYAQEANLTRHSRDFQVETLHHELVHALGFDRSGPFIPNWVHEGHADYLALDQPRASAVAGSDGRLPLDYEFVTGGRAKILLAYRESTSAVSYLADTKGDDGPTRVFEALGDRRLEPGTWEYHLDQALTEVYGKGFEAFQSDWNGGR